MKARDPEMLDEYDFSQGRRGRYASRYAEGAEIERTRKLKLNEDQFFVERREDGDYAVRKGGAKRASAVEPTQSEAIERARAINPDAAIHVERVRNTSNGSLDKWRKP